MNKQNRVIVALDKPDHASAIALAKRLDPELCRVKVGKELFTAAGPGVVEALHVQGFQVFLDLKFHDIPNTVAGACRVAADLGVWMVNVHAAGGASMMKAARDAVGPAGEDTPLLIAVTVLTSMDESALQQTGVECGIDEQVKRLTVLVDEAGLDGVVCSAMEASVIKSLHPGLVAVTPGIRLLEDSSDDQKRIMTPDKAVSAGADYLVIGRSITGASEPVKTLAAIQQLLD